MTWSVWSWGSTIFSAAFQFSIRTQHHRQIPNCLHIRFNIIKLLAKLSMTRDSIKQHENWLQRKFTLPSYVVTHLYANSYIGAFKNIFNFELTSLSFYSINNHFSSYLSIPDKSTQHKQEDESQTALLVVLRGSFSNNR